PSLSLHSFPTRRSSDLSWATGLSVVSAVLTCLVVVLLFGANLTRSHFGDAIALLFMASMLAIGAGFGVFLLETTIAARAVRVRSDRKSTRLNSSHLGIS